MHDPSIASVPGPTETTGTLVDGIVSWARRLIPDPERAERLAGDLQSTFAATAAGSFGTPVTERALRDIESVCHRTARHLTLELTTPAQPDTDVVGWPAVPPQVIERRAGFLRRVERFDNGCGYLAIDGFDDIRYAADYLRGAFAVLRGTEGLILDLRHNGGGEVATLTLLAEFVLGTGIEHLATVHYRDRPDHQWWTSGLLGTAHLPTDRPVAVLIGSGTYSSGETLAYHLQTRGRARLFGKRTPGAADHVTPIRVTPSVVALIPEATTIDAVSGTNWEGTGVLPDVDCEPEHAQVEAMAWLTETR
ncbi:MAG: S41 family peptidase [Nakamurella sp.]